MSTASEKYDARFPDVDIPEAQKEERQQRADFKGEVRSLSRTSRNRGIVIPREAWERVFGGDREETSR